MKKLDAGYREQEKLLNKLEERISQEYAESFVSISHKADEYFLKFKKEDAKNLELLESGKITKKDYAEWRLKKMAKSKQYNELRETIATDFVNADKIAMSYVNNYKKDAYALSMNYTTYDIEKTTRVNTSFTLYDRNAVEKLIKDDPDILPMAKVNVKKDLKWNRKKVNSALIQGILQGEDIPDIAKRLGRVTGMNKKSAIRSARTAMTSASNTARLDAYERAEDLGIKMKKVWIATLDDRTRDSHALLDGEERDIDEPFSNGLMYPADPAGEPAEVYNCRCTMVKQIDKYKTDWQDLANRNVSKLGNMTYEEWKDAHRKGGEDED